MFGLEQDWRQGMDEVTIGFRSGLGGIRSRVEVKPCADELTAY
jgi:hypothetical protein